MSLRYSFGGGESVVDLLRKRVERKPKKISKKRSRGIEIVVKSRLTKNSAGIMVGDCDVFFPFRVLKSYKLEKGVLVLKEKYKLYKNLFTGLLRIENEEGYEEVSNISLEIILTIRRQGSDVYVYG